MEKWPNTKALRGMNAADLREQVEKLRQDLWQQRVKTEVGATQQHHRRRAARRQIARVLTILNEQRGNVKG